MRTLGGIVPKPPRPVSVDEMRRIVARPLTVEHADVAWRAARLFAGSRADFADCMIEQAGHANSCGYTLTFDRLAVKGAGMRMLTRS